MPPIRSLLTSIRARREQRILALDAAAELETSLDALLARLKQRFEHEADLKIFKRAGRVVLDCKTGDHAFSILGALKKSGYKAFITNKYKPQIISVMPSATGKLEGENINAPTIGNSTKEETEPADPTLPYNANPSGIQTNPAPHLNDKKELSNQY